MARIAGVDLPKDKRVEVALTYIYGIGRPSANKILEKANVNKDTRVNKLTEAEVVRIRDIIEQEYKVENSYKCQDEKRPSTCCYREEEGKRMICGFFLNPNGLK